MIIVQVYFGMTLCKAMEYFNYKLQMYSKILDWCKGNDYVGVDI